MRQYKSVFVVEDDTNIRALLKEVIEAEGYVVFIASDGLEALKKLKMLKEQYLPCIILTDLSMPTMNGLELIEELKGSITLAAIPVVIVSGEKNGVHTYHKFIPKPFSITSIINAVTEECDEEQPTRAA